MSEAGTNLRPGAVTGAAEPLVRCEALTVRFVGREGTVRAVNGVDFTLDAGEVLCIVGESGAGEGICTISSSSRARCLAWRCESPSWRITVSMI